MASKEVILYAAAELEELAAIAKQIVLDMREDAQRAATHENAYARVYWFRARLTTHVVSRLGNGQPSGKAQMDRTYLGI